MKPAVDSAGVRPELIVLAREARGLTQSQLAAALDMSQGHLSRIEGGLLTVSEAILGHLSAVLDYPPQFFTLPEPLYGPGSSEFFHRMRKSISARALARLHAQVNIGRIHLSRLLSAVELDADHIPELDPDAFPGSVEDVARAVRAAWGLPRGPVDNVTRSIEEAGGIVLLADFETPQLDALSRHVPGMPPLFFANRESPGDRTRMSLAHELGHMVMHRVPLPDMEEQAFRFAGEFLMPERDIKHELAGLTLDRLVALKLRWKVSMQGILVRAESVGIVTPRRARYLWMQMSKAGMRLREPSEADVAVEKPAALIEILDIYRHTLGYSVSDIAELLALSPHEFERHYGLRATLTDTRARLRMISSA